jgi:hypothetical protein
MNAVHSVPVVGGADDDGIEGFFGVEEFAVIAVGLGPRQGRAEFAGLGDLPLVDIAQGDDVLAAAEDVLHVAAPLAAATHEGHVEFAPGAGGPQNPRPPQRQGAGGERRGFQQVAAGKATGFRRFGPAHCGRSFVHEGGGRRLSPGRTVTG